MNAQPKKPARGNWRIPRTVSLNPDQDRYLTELLGANGNVSEYLRNLVDAAREGRLALPHAGSSDETNTLNRARLYHKAKEAGMHFEEDTGAVLDGLLKTGGSGLKVVRNRIHNGDGVFVADFSVEKPDGTVVFSVVCKSSPRPDRLALALAEAMIGVQKTGAPVVTVVPYLMAASDDAAARFTLNGFRLCRLSELAGVVKELTGEPGDRVTRRPGSLHPASKERGVFVFEGQDSGGSGKWAGIGGVTETRQMCASAEDS